MSKFDQVAWSKSKIAKLLKGATFVTSASGPKGYLEDVGIEVAFAGRSNVGKSTCLNTITQQKRLAHASKTPGRTQLINFFELSEDKRLVDLPGYGYAKVPLAVKKQWAKNIETYLAKRNALAGMVWLVDVRRELAQEDFLLLDWLVSEGIPTQLLLCKVDKLSRNQTQQAIIKLRQQLMLLRVPDGLLDCQPYSSLTRQGVEQLGARLASWFAIDGVDHSID